MRGGTSTTEWVEGALQPRVRKQGQEQVGGVSGWAKRGGSGWTLKLGG